MLAVLEGGSFMRWYSDTYGMEATQRVARGETVESVSGKSLVKNETEWLKALDAKHIEPRPCEVVVPKENIFNLLCRKLSEKPK